MERATENFIKKAYCDTPEKTLELIDTEIIFLTALGEKYDSPKQSTCRFNLNCAAYLLERLRDRMVQEKSFADSHEESYED